MTIHFWAEIIWIDLGGRAQDNVHIRKLQTNCLILRSSEMAHFDLEQIYPFPRGYDLIGLQWPMPAASPASSGLETIAAVLVHCTLPRLEGSGRHAAVTSGATYFLQAPAG